MKKSEIISLVDSVAWASLRGSGKGTPTKIAEDVREVE
jgi:hypothetical protein